MVECDTEVEEIEVEATPEPKQNPTDSEIEDYYEHEQEHLELWERKREKVSKHENIGGNLADSILFKSPTNS